jgi:hypothetical protein
MRSRKYVPGILVEGRGLRGPKGDKGDSLNVSEVSSYITEYMSNYASLTHSHGLVEGYNVSATSATNGLTLSVANPILGLHRVFGGSYISISVNEASTTLSVVGLQSSGNYLTTAADITHTHGSIYTETVSGGYLLNSSGSSGLTLSVPNYLTTAAESWHSHDGLYVNLSNSTLFASRTHIHGPLTTNSITGSNIAYTSSSNGLSLGIPNFITTAPATNHTHGNIYGVNITGISASNGVTLSVANTSHTHNQYIGLNTAITGGLMTANSSGISLNITGGGGTGGVAIGNTAAVPFTSGSVQFSGDNLTVNTSQGTGTQSTNQYIQLSVAAPAVAANSVYAGDYISLSIDGISTTVSASGLQATSAMSNYLAVSNSSNLIAVSASSNFIPQASTASFFLDIFSSLLQRTIDNSLSLGTIYTTHSHSQYLTTAAASDHTHTGYAANTHTHGSVAITGGIGVTSASSGLSVSLPSYLTTAANSTHTHGNVSLSLASLSGTYSSASNGLTLSLTNSTHAHPYVNTSEIGSIYFVNSDTRNQNITWGSTSGTGGTSIFATAGGSTGVGTGGVAIKGSGTNVASTGTVVFSNANDLTFGLSGNTITGSYAKGNVYFTNGSNVTWGSSVAGVNTSVMLTAGGGAYIRNSATTITSGTAYLSNANGISWGINGNTITASYDKGSIYFTNTNGVTFGSSSNGISTTISASVANIGPLYINNSTNSIDAGSVYFANGSNITISRDSNTVYFYAPNDLGIKAIGNTASSNAFTSGSVMLSGVNLTVNTSSTGASQYLQISAPAIGYLFFSNTNGHSWSSSVNGVSTSVYIIT